MAGHFPPDILDFEKDIEMKASLIAISFLAIGVTACSAEPAATEEITEVAAVDPGLIADLGGEPEGPIYTKNQGETLALSGYDAVSYFTGEAPVKGSGDFRVRYQGYDYQFATAESVAIFQSEPAKYAPQYGGYCAWAIGANDALAPGDPEVYKIVDGKLYLNFSEDVAKKWQVDIPGFIEKADKNYPTHDASEHYTS
jgi:YHS domain-containing protein